MYWTTIRFDVPAWSDELGKSLIAWREHIEAAHPKVTEVRAYRFNGGTTVVWQEGFGDFRDLQDLQEQEDDDCAAVMAEVFRHAVPGTRTSAIWSGAI